MPDGDSVLCFVVVRFYLTEKDPNEYMEVSLASWLVGELDDNMDGWTRWPPDSKPISQFVKTQAARDDNWNKHRVQVMKFYETFLGALRAAPKFLEDSHYETEGPELPKKRRRIRPQRLIETSSSEDERPLKLSSKPIKPPPPIQVKPAQQGSSRHGLGKDEAKKQERAALLEKLKHARAVAAAKTKSPGKRSPWKISNHEETPPTTPPKTPPQATSPITPQAGTSSTHQAAPLRTPSVFGSPIPSHHGSEYFDPSDYVEVQHTDAEDNNLMTPVMTPMKTPEKPSESRLQRSNAFCLSPQSAAAYSKKILNRAAARESENVKGVKRSAETDKTVMDGRRNLFSANANSLEDTIATVESRLKRIEERTHKASSKMDIMLMNLGRIQRSLLPAKKRIQKPHNMPNLPLESKEALTKFEAFLKENDGNVSAVCDYMSSYIKTSVPDPERKSTHNVLTHLLYNDLAKEMNLEGGNHKIGFRGLELYKVFLGTMKNAFPDSDLEVAEKALQNWLKDAKWRKPKVADKSARESSKKPPRKPTRCFRSSPRRPVTTQASIWVLQEPL